MPRKIPTDEEQIEQLMRIIDLCYNFFFKDNNPLFLDIWRDCLKDVREIRKEMNESDS